MTLPVTPSGEQYYAKYGWLKRMTPSSGLGYAFGNGVATHRKPLVTRERRELLTGVYSFDPRVLHFQRALSNALDAELPPGLDDDGFCTNGVHTDWGRLRTVAGYMPTPMSYTPLDNAFYREELGLTPGYSQDEQIIANNVWDLIFSEYKASHIKVPKKSTSGPRRNTSDAEWKKDFAVFLYESDRFEGMLQCVDKSDWQTLANEVEMLFLMYIQKRDQVDTPGKERLVFDLEYALSNGRKGKAFPTNKTVEIDGAVYDDFSSTRARVIHAGPWAINCVLQIISSGHMQSMFERFPKVFHTSTPDQIKSIIDGHHVECGDVKEYDRSMSKDAVDTVHTVGERWWDRRLMKMSKLLYYSPYYSRPLSIDGSEGTFVGDPRLMEEQVICGNRSGHAWTSLVAKVNKCIDTLIVFHRMGLPVINEERTYFESKGAINFINNGDDEIVYTESAELMASYKKIRYSGKAGHYHVDSEKGQGYSGLLLMKDGLTYTPTGKIHTAFEKIYVPERSIGGNFRRYWPIGIIERVNNQDANPSGQRAWEIHNRLFRDMMAPHFGDFLTIVNTALERMDLQLDGLTAADRDVLENEDRIHYKYLESDISPEVYQRVTSKIPSQIYKHIYQSYYGGKVNESPTVH